MERNIVLSENEIKEICERIGKEITLKFKNAQKVPVIVGVMKGALNFMMDLIKYIDIPVFIDYIQVSSYSGTKTSGTVRLVKDLSFNCENRAVVIVEDIIDTGYSMSFLLKHIKSHNPGEVYVCALFDKKNARKVPVNVDFVGKELEKNDFLVGYGLDYNELERNVPYVYCATKEDVERLNAYLDNEAK